MTTEQHDGTGLALDELTAQVQQHYAAAAAAAATSCCSPDAPPDAVLPAAERDLFGAGRYAIGLTDLPAGAVTASLGCGEPTAIAELHPGEVVLDLGSGAGLDVLLSARRVGPTGHAYGVDLTPEMLALARRNAEEAGATNVTFLAGRIEAVPLPDDHVDVVLSNCVINLSGDKAAVFTELARVVRPGGRLAISDVVAEDHLAPAERAERGSHVGCIAGALSFEEYRRGLEAVGFTDVEVVPTHQVADAMHAAIIRGTRSPNDEQAR